MAAQTLRFAPRGVARWTDAARVERVPRVATQAAPPIVFARRPLTLRTANLALARASRAARLAIGLDKTQRALHVRSTERIIDRAVRATRRAPHAKTATQGRASCRATRPSLQAR